VNNLLKEILSMLLISLILAVLFFGVDYLLGWKMSFFIIGYIK